MDKFSIEGPNRIRGEVKISGSKNSSLPISGDFIIQSASCAKKFTKGKGY